MIKQILKNEIKTAIGHMPSDAEFKSAIKYLSDYAESHHALSDIEVLLLDWKNECLKQCDNCQEWFLELITCNFDSRLYGKHFCNMKCCDEWLDFHPHERPEISEHI